MSKAAQKTVCKREPLPRSTHRILQDYKGLIRGLSGLNAPIITRTSNLTLTLIMKTCSAVLVEGVMVGEIQGDVRRNEGRYKDSSNRSAYVLWSVINQAVKTVHSTNTVD
jgi:hypothetical protein